MRALFGLIVGGGIVGGIWLAVVGQWSILGAGLVAITISLFVLSFMLISLFTSAAAQPDSETKDGSDVKTAPTDEDTWYVLVNGKELGPAKFDGLAQLAVRGVLPKDIKMRRSGSNHWVAAGEIPGLFPTTAVSEATVPPEISRAAG